MKFRQIFLVRSLVANSSSLFFKLPTGKGGWRAAAGDNTATAVTTASTIASDTDAAAAAAADPVAASADIAAAADTDAAAEAHAVVAAVACTLNTAEDEGNKEEPMVILVARTDKSRNAERKQGACSPVNEASFT